MCASLAPAGGERMRSPALGAQRGRRVRGRCGASMGPISRGTPPPARCARHLPAKLILQSYDPRLGITWYVMSPKTEVHVLQETDVVASVLGLKSARQRITPFRLISSIENGLPVGALDRVAKTIAP